MVGSLHHPHGNLELGSPGFLLGIREADACRQGSNTDKVAGVRHFYYPRLKAPHSIDIVGLHCILTFSSRCSQATQTMWTVPLRGQRLVWAITGKNNDK
jgi:hypothetical protein